MCFSASRRDLEATIPPRRSARGAPEARDPRRGGDASGSAEPALEPPGRACPVRRRIDEIVLGKRGVTALRLARYFGTSERFWMNLQARYDLEVERGRLGARLDREVEIRKATG
jgi:hypothetical protein